MFAACKYEDGPLFSIRSKHDRLNGSWKFKEVLVDGIDSTAAYQQRFPIIDFISNQELWSAYQMDVQMEFVINQITHDNIIALCYFNKNKTFLHVGYANGTTNPNSMGFIGSVGDQVWEILKLTNVNLWFKINTNDRVYMLKLKSTNKKF